MEVGHLTGGSQHGFLFFKEGIGAREALSMQRPVTTPGAFLQTPAPVLDTISGPLGAGFLSSAGLQFATRIARAQLLPAPALDKISIPNYDASNIASTKTLCPRMSGVALVPASMYPISLLDVD